MSYQVTAPLVLARDKEGKVHERYQGSVIDWLPEDQAKHFLEAGLAVQLAGPVDTDEASADRPAESATKPVLVKWIVDNLEKSDGSRYDAAEFKTTNKPALWALINAADEDDKPGPDADTAELVDWLEDHGDYDRAELEAQSDDQLRELIEATEV